MAQMSENAKVNHVYYRVGKFKDQQAPRFLKAPFDVVTIDGELYVQPVAVCGDAEGAAAQSVVGDSEQTRLVRQEFYTDLNPIVVEEQEMGAEDDSKSWKGVHCFGMI